MEDIEAIGMVNAKSANRARLRMEKAQREALKRIKTRCFILFISRAMVYAVIGLLFIALGVYKQVAPWISGTGAIVCIVLLAIHIDRKIGGRAYGEGFADTYKKKSAGGKISIRRAQFKIAEKNASMAIWLGKQFHVGGSLDGKPFYELFDPAIRDSAYAARYNLLCAQLEREVGTSAGILTKPENRGTTAYEIKSDNYDTFCLVSDIRKNIKSCLDDVAYAIDVYAEYFNLTPAGAAGDYKVTYDWDTSLIESSTEKFNQLSELESRGLISGARLNSYVTGQSMEDAQAEIDAVAKEQPKNTNTMLAPEDFEPDVG